MSQQADEFNISPNYTGKSFGGNPTYEQKLLIFEDRVLGWQLDIAEDLRKQIEDKRNEGKPIQQAGFAILSILSSYFEMITQFIEGQDSDKKSKDYFGKGLERVFPNEFQPPHKATLYGRLRCGMFHSGLVKKGVLISAEYGKAIQYDDANDLVKVNPHKLSIELKADFEKFIDELEKGAGTEIQTKFEAVFAVIGKGVYN